MAGITDYLEGKTMDHLFGGTVFPPPATLYFALYTTLPDTETGASGTEVSGGSYVRVAVTNNTTNFPNYAAGSKSNGTVITFPTPTANWGAVVGVGVLDAASAGNPWIYRTLTTPKTINNGDPAPSFAIGAFALTVD